MSESAWGDSHLSSLFAKQRLNFWKFMQSHSQPKLDLSAYLGHGFLWEALPDFLPRIQSFPQTVAPSPSLLALLALIPHLSLLISSTQSQTQQGAGIMSSLSSLTSRLVFNSVMAQSKHSVTVTEWLIQWHSSCCHLMSTYVPGTVLQSLQFLYGLKWS